MCIRVVPIFTLYSHFHVSESLLLLVMHGISCTDKEIHTCTLMLSNRITNICPLYIQDYHTYYDSDISNIHSIAHI